MTDRQDRRKRKQMGKNKNNQENRKSGKKLRKPGKIVGFFAVLFSALCLAGVVSLGVMSYVKETQEPEKRLPSVAAQTEEEPKAGKDPAKTSAAEDESSAEEQEETAGEEESAEEAAETTEEETTEAETTEEETEEETDPEPDQYTQFFGSVREEQAAKEKVLDQYEELGVIDGVKNYLNMRSGPSTEYEVVGIIFKYCGVDILEEKDGWYRIRSGGAEGYVKKEYIITGREARKLAMDHMDYQAVVIPDVLGVYRLDGEHITDILKGEKYHIKGFNNSLVNVEAVEGLDGYVNMGDVRCSFFLDEAIVFSLNGVSQIRRDIINYALQFYGGKYVWGGHNLETGVDCSGYIYCVYTEAFGIDMIEPYSITQSTVGRTVTEETIKPGDLIFYVGRYQGQIGHVAIYIGDGKILHAASESKGICVSSWKYVPPVTMKNVIGD